MDKVLLLLDGSQVKATKKLYRQAIKTYYDGQPIMEDSVFDALESYLLSAGKIDQEVGESQLNESRKREHQHGMYSLAKVRDVDYLHTWLASTESQGWVVEPKYDGLSMSIEYKNGKLKEAITRGNGVVGEDVTEAAKVIRSIPNKVKTKEHFWVRGEVLISHGFFQKLNDYLKENEQDQFVNARNAAAGILRRLDTEFAGKYLTFIAYDAILSDKVDQQERYQVLDHNGFETPYPCINVTDPEEIFNHVWELEHPDTPFDTDGVVIKSNSVKDQDRLGYSRTSPNFSIAWKFASESDQTILRDVTWATGKTGRIVPRAVFDETFLSGATIQHASLHNYAYLQELDLAIGDTIEITRSNEVIPYVLGKVTSNSNSQPITIIEACPSCKGPVELSGRDLVCSKGAGCNTSRAIVEALRAIGVDGVSHALVETLIEEREADNVFDVLTTKKKHIKNLDGYGERSAELAVNAMKEAVQSASLEAWIVAIGIPGISWANAEQLAAAFGNLDNLGEATYDELLALPGFGDSRAVMVQGTSRKILEWSRLITQRLGITPKYEEVEVATDTPFSGLNIVVTGKLPSFSRNEIADALVSAGAIVQGSVNAKTDLLITGEKAESSSKFKKAQELQTKMMSGELAEELLQG